MRLLDLCCRAGGASCGYRNAGWEVVGVDIEPQRDYPFEFHQADAFEFARSHWREFDAIHASPHCQGYIPPGGHMRRKDGSEKPRQVEAFREMLEGFGLPYVIENVSGAPLIDQPLFGTRRVMLCGTMFALRTPCGAELQRHRLFELNWDCPMPPPCRHGWAGVIGVYGGHARDRRRVISVFGHHYRDQAERSRQRRRTITVTGSTPQQNVIRNEERHVFSVEDAKAAMGIDWMTMADLSQAVPPAFTEFLGRYLKSMLSNGTRPLLNDSPPAQALR